MIKFLVFFVLGAATLYFIIRSFVNSEPGRLKRFFKVIFVAAIIFGIVYILAILLLGAYFYKEGIGII